MASDILNQIQNNMSGFSKGQKLIANYILEYYDKAAFMTASRLGKTVSVSESTVVRFAVELGYEGYPEMQRALQEMIRNKLTSVQRLEVANDRIGQGDVLSAVLHSDVDKIRQTLEKADREVFNAAADAILASNKLYILGVRSASALASFFGFYMNLMFDHVQLVAANSTSEMFEQLVRVAPGDAVLGISFPRYSSRTIEAMEFAKSRGAELVAITDGPLSPLHARADLCLTAKSDMASFVDSLVAPLSLINALIVALGQRRRQQVAAYFDGMERIWDEYHVYLGKDKSANE